MVRMLGMGSERYAVVLVPESGEPSRHPAASLADAKSQARALVGKLGGVATVEDAQGEHHGIRYGRDERGIPRRLPD